MNLIFLDIDGVLNGDYVFAKMTQRGENWPIDTIDAEKLPILNRLVSEGDAAIVVSSSWRMHYDVQQLRGILAGKGLLGQIIDSTPVINRGVQRGVEIAAWLADNQHLDVRNFVILDDMADMEPLMDHLVQTDDAVGLTEADVELALGVLRRAQ